MLIRIPLGNEHRVTASAETWRAVTCEHCGCDFVYALTVKGIGQASSPLFLVEEAASRKAAIRARQALEKAIPTAWRVAACPRCGKYQRTMLRAERWRLINGTMAYFVLGALVIGTLVFTTTAHLTLSLAVAAGVIGVPLIVIISRTSRLDAAAAERVRDKEDGAVLSREEFERVVAAP